MFIVVDTIHVMYVPCRYLRLCSINTCLGQRSTPSVSNYISSSDLIFWDGGSNILMKKKVEQQSEVFFLWREVEGHVILEFIDVRPPTAVLNLANPPL